jgi:hypothetical protein
VVADQRRNLLRYLATLPDPRDRRGLRRHLAGVLAVAVCAVLAGASSLSAIGEWAADAPADVLLSLGIRPDPLTGQVRAPDEATVRRVLAAIDAEAMDAAVGAWLQAARSAQASPPPTVARTIWPAVAVDGKTLRGSGPAGAQVHLLAVMDHGRQAVLGQVQVDEKSNEITAFTPLLDRLDLAGTVVTSDALCRARHKASYADLIVMPLGRRDGVCGRGCGWCGRHNHRLSRKAMIASVGWYRRWETPAGAVRARARSLTARSAWT